MFLLFCFVNMKCNYEMKKNVVVYFFIFVFEFLINKIMSNCIFLFYKGRVSL